MDRPNPPLAPAPDKGSEEHCQNHPSSERREWHVGTDKQIGQGYASPYPGSRPFRRSPDSIASPAKITFNRSALLPLRSNCFAGGLVSREGRGEPKAAETYLGS